MADYFCTFLDSRSFTTFSLFIPHYKPPKPFFTLLPSLQFHNPTSSCSRKRKLVNLTMLCTPISSTPSSPDFDLVSTSECSDGSFLFRFGDASEIESIVELGEPSCEVNGLKVLDGDDEREVVVKTIEREVRSTSSTELADSEKELVINGEDTSVDEKESDFQLELSERLLEVSQEGELQACVSDINTNDSSSSVLDYEDVHTRDDSLKKDENENLGSMRISVPDSSFTIENDGDSEKFLEENSGSDSMSDPGNLIVSVIEVPQNNVCEESSQENVSIEATGTEESAQSDSVKSPVMASQVDSVEIPTMVPIIEVPQNNVCEESSQENVNTEARGTEESAQSDCVESPTMVPIIEVPQNNVCEESSQENVSTEARGTEESAQSDNVESPIMAAQEYSVDSPITEAEITEGEALNGDLTEVSGAGAVEVKLTQTSLNRGESSTAGLFLSSGAALLLHPLKALAGGEESYLVTNLNWLGVADGVGQWSLEGMNPGVYARELMENCGKIVSNSSSVSIINPLEVLKRSVEEAQSPGSSTILVAYFDGQALHVANIGDSGFIIIRNDAVHNRSSPMLHEFNFPLQIERGHDPSELVEEYKIDLEEGDIIVTATDGLFDNLYEQEITSIVLKSLQANINPQETAKLLARRAQYVGKSSSARSPFADAAQAAGYVGYTGGKLDDVAIIVSLVQKRFG